jgi:hypothetical protein
MKLSCLLVSFLDAETLKHFQIIYSYSITVRIILNQINKQDIILQHTRPYNILLKHTHKAVHTVIMNVKRFSEFVGLYKQGRVGTRLLRHGRKKGLIFFKKERRKANGNR